MKQQVRKDRIFKKSDGGHFEPEVMATLNGIFDLVCEESAIPVNATAERNWLARQILSAYGRNPDAAALVQAARKAVADYRK